MNKQIKIEVNGLQKPLIDAEKLNNTLDELVGALDSVAATANKVSDSFGDSFNSIAKDVKNAAKSIKDNLGKSLVEQASLVDGLASTIKSGFMQINLASLESLDTFFDFETEFRDKMINLANVAGNLAEAFGPVGMAASFALQLLAPVFADLVVSMQKSNKEAYRFGQILDGVAKAEEDVADELDQAVIKLGVLNKETKQTKQSKQELTLVNGQLTSAEYRLGEAFGAELSELNGLYTALLDVNTATADRKILLEEFMGSYGGYLSGLEQEKVTLIDIVALYEQQIIKMLSKDIADKYKSQFDAIQGVIMTFAEEYVKAQDMLDQMDTAGPFSKNLGREGRSYEEWKAIRDAAQEQIQAQQRQLDELRGKMQTEVTSYGRALGLTISMNGKDTKLAYDKYDATKKQRIEQEKITKELEAQNKLRSVKFYEGRSQATTEDFNQALESGNLELAEELLRKRRVQFDNYIGELKAANQDIGKIEAEIKKAQETIEKAEKDFANAAARRAADLGKLGLTGQSTVYASILGIDTKNIPEQFKTVVNGREAVKKFIVDASKNFDQAKAEYERIVSDYLSSGTMNEEQLFAQLRAAGITSIFETQAKLDRDALARSRDENRKTIQQYQKLKEEGKVDVTEIEDKFSKELQADLDKITNARIKRQQEIEEKSLKIQAATNLLAGPLGQLTLSDYKQEIMDENEIAIREILKEAENALNSFNQMGKKYITFSGGGISAGDLKDLVDLEQISQQEYENAIKLINNYNERIRLEVENGNQKLAQATVDFGENAFEFIKKNLERTMRSLAIDLDSGLIKWEARYTEAAEASAKAIEKRGSLSGKALQKAKTDSERLLKELEPLKDLEIAQVGGIYLEKLQEVIKSGGDVSLIIKELNLDIAKVIAKYEEMRKQAEAIVAPPRVLTAEEWTQMATDITNRLMGVAGAFGDFLAVMSDNLISTIQGSLSEIESAISDSESRMASLEDDLQGKISGRRDAVLAAIELEKERNKALQQQKIALERQLLKEQEKAARRRKAMAISEAIINGALGIMQIWATKSVLPSPAAEIVKGINTAALAATTALQVATISQQKFATGGYTGNGTTKDETGHRVAGIVHEGEWVAPKWMVNSPQFSKTISALEASRQRGYATGGLVSDDVAAGISTSLNPNMSVMREMKAYTDAALRLSNRPVIVDVKEFSNVQSSMARRVRTNSIG